MMMMNCCVQCFRCEPIVEPHCSVNPGLGCLYGLAHMFPEPAKPIQAKKADTSRCTLCGLHPKNPLSSTNGCTHQYFDSAVAEK